MNSKWCEYIPVKYNYLEYDDMLKYRPGNGFKFKEY